MNSGEIAQELEKLARNYRLQVRQEWDEFAVTMWISKALWEKLGTEDAVVAHINERIKSEALNHISSKRSSWSGGFSVTNMCEQIQREEAVEQISGFTSGYPASRLEALANVPA